MIKRIHELIHNKGVSIRKFEQSIHASNGLIRKAIANNTDVQSKWILEIAEIYPNINLEWLIRGEGEMFRDIASNGRLAALKEEEMLYELNLLKGKIDSLQILIESKDALIYSQGETIKSKDEVIATKDQLIEKLLMH